jgi:hypothetical protein
MAMLYSACDSNVAPCSVTILIYRLLLDRSNHFVQFARENP